MFFCSHLFLNKRRPATFKPRVITFFFRLPSSLLNFIILCSDLKLIMRQCRFLSPMYQPKLFLRTNSLSYCAIVQEFSQALIGLRLLRNTHPRRQQENTLVALFHRHKIFALFYVKDWNWCLQNVFPGKEVQVCLQSDTASVLMNFFVADIDSMVSASRCIFVFIFCSTTKAVSI